MFFVLVAPVSADSTSDLNLFYHFNESSGSIQDYSGSGFSGTVVGSPDYRVSGDPVGDDPYAMNFTGLGDLVETGQSGFAEGTSELTVSTRFYPRTDVATFDSIPEDNQRLVSKAEGGVSNSWLAFYNGAGGQSQFLVWTGGSSTTLDTDLSQNGIESWHHAVFRFDNGNMSIFLDGEMIATKSASGSTIDSTSSDVTVNGRASNDDQNFLGRQDEVKIYNKALNSSEITNLYNNGDITVSDSGGGSSNTAPSVDDIDPDDGATDVNDTADGSGIDVDLGVLASDSENSTLNHYYYWGNGSLIETVSGVSNNTYSNITIQNLDQATTYDWYVEVGDGVTNTTSNTYSFSTASDSTFEYKYDLLNSDTSDELFLSVNGTSSTDAGLDSLDHWIYGTFRNNVTDLEYQDQFSGGLNETQVIDQGNSGQEKCAIQTIPEKHVSCPNPPSDLRAFYTFDESKSQAQDYIGGNDGSLIDGVSQGESGVVGNAFGFSDGDIQVPNDASLDVQNGDFSIWARVYINESTSDTIGNRARYIIQRKDVSGVGDSQLGYGLATGFGSKYCESQSDGLVFLFGDGSNWICHASGTQIPTGQWVTVGAVYDQTNDQVEIYYNGERQVQQSETATPYDSNGELVIGNHYGANANSDSLFKGRIDEVRIYGSDLSQSEMKSLSNLNVEASGDSPNVVDPISFTLHNPQNQSYYDSNVPLDVSTEDDLSNWRYNLDSQGNQSFTPNTTLEDLSVGTHDLTVWAENSTSGNWTRESISFSVTNNWLIDTQSDFNSIVSDSSNIDIGSDLSLSGGSSSGYFNTVLNTQASQNDYNKLDFKSEDFRDFTLQDTFSQPSNDQTPFYVEEDQYELKMVGLDGGQSAHKCDPDTVDCRQFSNWELIDSQLFTIDQGSGGGTNINWGVHVNSTYYFFTSVNDEDTGLYTADVLESSNITNHGIIANRSDSGGYYNRSSGVWHIATEGEPYDGEPSSNYLIHWKNTGDSRNANEWVEQGRILDLTDVSYHTGDPEFTEIDGKLCMTSDRSTSHPTYNIQSFGCQSNFGDEWQPTKQITSSFGGDLEYVYVPEYDEFLGFTEYTQDQTQGGIWSSTMPFTGNVDAKIEVDTDDDGVIDESSGYLSVDHSYSLVGDDGSFLTESASIVDTSLSSSYGQKVSINLSQGNDPLIGSFELMDYTPEDTTAPTSSDNWTASDFVDKSSVDVELTASDNSGGSGVANISYRLNGGSYTTVSGSSKVVTISQQQNNTLEYYATDNAGNQESVNTEYIALDAGPTYIQINESVQINQSSNNAYINVTNTLNLSSLTLYNDATNFGGINWSINGDTADRIDVKLSYFNDENPDDTYLANYSVSTAVGNVVTSTFSPVPLDSVYQVFRDDSFFKQVQADAQQVVDFGYEQVNTAYRSFAVKRTDQFRPEINSTTYKLDQPGTTERLEFVLWARNNSNDIASSSGAGTRIELTNTSMIYNVSLPVSSTYSVTDTEGLTRNRLIDLSKTDSGVTEDDEYSHTLDSQKRLQELNITNNGDTWTLYNWTSELDNTQTGNISTSSTETLSDSETGDFINNQTFNFAPEQGEIVLGFNYTGVQPLEIENTVATSFTGVSTTGGVGQFNSCSQVNNSEIDVSGGELKNYSVGHTCNPGGIGSPTQDIQNISDDTERVWYNSTDMQINTNYTENNPIVIRADKSNLKNPDQRDGGSLSAYVEGVNSGNSNELNVTDTGSFFRVTVGSGFQTSSLHTDDSTWSVTYTLSGENTTIIQPGGGGGGGADVESQVIYFGSAETEDGLETVSVPFGETAVRNMTVVNERQSPTTAQVYVGDTGVCQYISVQRTLDSDQFGNGGTYDLPAATQTLGTVEATEQFRVRYDLPNKTVLESNGITDYSCEFETGSSYGTAEPLNIQLSEGFDFFGLFDFLGEEFCFEIPVDGVTGNLTDISGDDGGREVCVTGWQIGLLLALLLVAGYLVLRRSENV